MQEKNIKMHCCFYCGGLFFRSIVMIRVSELGTGAGSSSAPLQLHSELLRSCNFFFIEERAGLSRQKWSAPLQLRSSGAFHFFFNFAIAAYTCTGFSQWTRCWASVIFLTTFLLAILFPVARALCASVHEVGICFHSVQSPFDLSRVQYSSKCFFSLQFRPILLIVSYLIIF